MDRLLRFLRRLGTLAVGIVLLTGWAAPASADEPPEAMMLVATPALVDPLYGASVVVARPIGGGQFLGFILNKPSTVTVAEAFPAHAPSQQLSAPIFVGGPERPNTIFALVNSEHSPGQGSVRLTSDLFLVVSSTTLDQVILHDSGNARFLVGAVLWQPGELELEIKSGAWYVEEPEIGLMMRKEIGNLWEELVDRREGNRKAI